MGLRKISRDRKNNKVCFLFKERYSQSETEYLVDESTLESMLEHTISSLWFIQKRIDGRVVFPEFPPSETVVRIFNRAAEVLGDKKTAGEWLRDHQPALGGHIPLDLLWSDDGAKEVEDLLVRIDHGVVL